MALEVQGQTISKYNENSNDNNNNNKNNNNHIHNNNDKNNKNNKMNSENNPPTLPFGVWEQHQSCKYQK